MSNSPLLLIGLALVLGTPAALADNAIENPGFEAGKEKWGPFIPSESQGIQLKWDVSATEPHGGTMAAEMASGEAARWVLTPSERIPVNPGEKYRVTAWVRFGEGAQLVGNAPAAYVRLVLSDAAKQDIPDPMLHLHLGLAGDVVRSTAIARINVPDLPTGWQKIEGVIEVPPDVALIGLNLVVHGVVGTTYWDDVSFELVPAETPLSPVLEK
jgi:hypothetical protein